MEERTTSFGEWLRRRRKALDLTQEVLAQRVGYASGTIKKIEADARRPSRELAERLAAALEVPPEERVLFLKVARADLAPDHLDVAPSAGRSQPVVSRSEQRNAQPSPPPTFPYRPRRSSGVNARWPPRVPCCAGPMYGC